VRFEGRRSRFAGDAGGNSAGGDGGAIWSRTVADTTITNCLIKSNVAGGNGGGVNQELGNLTITAPFFAFTFIWIGGNLAHEDGGGVYCNDATRI